MSQSRKLSSGSGKSFLDDSSPEFSIEEFGSIAWYVTAAKRFPTSGISDGVNAAQVSADVRITDCMKTINLQFNFRTPQELKYRLEKVDKLIAELGSFRESLQKAGRAAQKWAKAPYMDYEEFRKEHDDDW